MYIMQTMGIRMRVPSVSGSYDFPSFQGQYDMAGNVMEWVDNCYEKNSVRAMSKKIVGRLSKVELIGQMGLILEYQGATISRQTKVLMGLGCDWQ